ncbi:MAG: TetR/AcrR family transcriptional regulator [Candidatus Omnitrophica bacterium]|nr:TetR/AcrR family transcriptional regulator [Candidatus Omnitrophota bacterium]
MREKKYAKTKVSLTKAFIKRVQQKAVADISIKDVCEEVGVAEKTFYNYFPHKTDLIEYHLQLEGKRILHQVDEKAKSGGPVKFIEVLFDLVAEHMENSKFAHEVMRFILDYKYTKKKIKISEGEVSYAFSDIKCPNKFLKVTIDEVIEQKVKEVLKQTKLKNQFLYKELTITILSILVGTPIIIKKLGLKDIKEKFRNQIQLCWKGLGIK